MCTEITYLDARNFIKEITGQKFYIPTYCLKSLKFSSVENRYMSKASAENLKNCRGMDQHDNILFIIILYHLQSVTASAIAVVNSAY